ncbi:cytochrome b [Undibacterium sp. Di26W]|uniref:cytochrome b n=1 Tax=Undibacterium sp. Di26W TaxID=3413035 RepID=UPI003BEFF2ED
MSRTVISKPVATRYQPVLVALHWLVALLIIGLLCVGFFVLENMSNSDPKKLDVLVLHMSGGMLVLVLMLVRVIIRRWSARPAAATTGSSLLDRLASLAHFGLYAIVFLMIISGYITGWLISSAFLPNGPPLPRFAALPSFQVHAVLAVLLVLLIAAHIAGALYHQLVLKDGLLHRMWFGKRIITSAEK